MKVGHRSQFDAQAVKRQLGIAVSSWDAFMVRMKALSERKVSDAAAEKFLRRVLTYPTTNPANPDVLAVNERAIKAVAELCCQLPACFRSRRCRARARLTSGYTPKASVFCFPR